RARRERRATAGRRPVRLPRPDVRDRDALAGGSDHRGAGGSRPAAAHRPRPRPRPRSGRGRGREAAGRLRRGRDHGDRPLVDRLVPLLARRCARPPDRAPAAGPRERNDGTPEQDAVLRDIQVQLRGPSLAGWPQLGTDADGRARSLVDGLALALRRIEELTAETAELRAQVAELRTEVSELEAGAAELAEQVRGA